MYSSHWIQGMSYKFKVVNFGHLMSGICNICVFCYLTEIMKMEKQSLFETNCLVSFFFCSECCHFATSRGDKYKNFLLYFPIFIPVQQHYFVLKIMLRFFFRLSCMLLFHSPAGTSSYCNVKNFRERSVQKQGNTTKHTLGSALDTVIL